MGVGRHRMVRRQSNRDGLDEDAVSGRLASMLQGYLPCLREELLKRLIASEESRGARALADELRLHGVRFEVGEACAMLVIRLEEGFRDFGFPRDPVLEFAVQNIAEEVLRTAYRHWRCQDKYGHLVYLIAPKNEAASLPLADGAELASAADASAADASEVAERIQRQVSVFLKLRILCAASSGGSLLPGQPYILHKEALDRLRVREDSIPPSAAERSAPGRRGSLAERVQAYVRRHLDEDVSLANVSAQVFLHPVYLSKLYKEQTGEGLADYIARMKMEYAAKLLLIDKNSRIYEIARKVGFRNQSYFCSVFKKRYGMTPQHYRSMYAPCSE